VALERRSASQVVTFTPQQAPWSIAVHSGGTIGVNQFFTVSTANAALMGIGDRFQLWTGASLKESTVFIVSSIGPPAAGFCQVQFLPNAQAIPTSSDTAISLPAPKNARWLGAIGHVSGLAYSFTMPGGPDTMQCLLRLPPQYRTDALNPGRVVQVWRGASCVWEGKLDEPQPSADGWTVTAHGAGNYGTDFVSYYTAWTADEPVNEAISRGLRWQNLGLGGVSGTYLGQQQDPGSQTITDFLNLLCTGGALLWQVTQGISSSPPSGPWQLSIMPFPTDANGEPITPVNRIIVSSSPVPRTIAADINTIVVRYQATADVPATSTKAAKAATYLTVIQKNATSVAQHGPMEYYLDISSAGVMTATAARAIAANVLQKYVRASFGGPFTVGPGQLLNAAGVPVDLGCEQAGTICQLMVTDAPYGGEVTAGAVTFLTGSYAFDDDSYTATITPYQSFRQDIGSLIAGLYPGKF
jgi:hypothetical protein